MNKSIAFSILGLLFQFIVVFSESITPQQPWLSCPSGIKPHKTSCICKKPENLWVAHKKVVEYYENGCFDKELTKVVQDAKQKFAAPAQHDKQVVIFDIDETVLSDYCNVKSIQFGYIPKLSHEWIMKAQAPAIPATKDFYHYLLKKGYHVIFITGRQHDEYEATQRNLKNEGFTGYDKLIVRSPEQKSWSAYQYKSAQRAKLVEEGYDIVGSIADQESDLTGGNVGIPIKMPNYMYHLD